MICIKNLTIVYNHSVKSADKVCVRCIKHLTTELFSFCYFSEKKTIHFEKCEYCISVNLKCMSVSSLLFLNTDIFNDTNRLTTYERLIT